MCLGVPAQVVELLGGPLRQAKVEVGGVRREVSLAFAPEAAAGEWVLVHVGFALAVIDEEEARATLALIEEAELAALRDGV